MFEAKISIRYGSEKIARSVLKAITPENKTAPEGVSVETTIREPEVVTDIKCERSLETFISTIDDLLSAIQLAEKTLSELKHAKS